MAYVQYKIENILQDVRTWAWAYIDDIICRAKSLSNLFKKLCIFFHIFFEYIITIKPSKSIFNYPNIGFLG